MKTPARTCFLPAALAALLTIGIVARGQENPPPPPAAPDATQTQSAVEPASAAPATAESAPEKSELRRLDGETSKPAAPVEATAAEAEKSPATPSAAAAEAPADQPESPATEKSTPPEHRRTHRVRHNGGNNERVNFGGDSTLAEGEQADAVVSIFGSSTSAGDVADAVVSVFGSSTSSGQVGDAIVSVLGSTRVTAGEVGDAAVSVLGTTYVNGHVHGPVVAVLGDVELGPEANVDEVVCVGGALKRDPGAVVHGQVSNVGIGVSFGGFEWLHAWVQHCLILGRPLAFGAHLMWAWWIALAALALYVVIGLLFPKGVEKCVQTLEEHPGYSVLTALLVTLLAPLAGIVLLVTVVGTPALVLFLFIAGFFGKAVILAWLGGKILRLFNKDETVPVVLAVLVGGVLMLLLYTVPFLGFIVAKLSSWLGLGVVVYAIIQGMKRPKPSAPRPVSGAPAGPASTGTPPTGSAPAGAAAMAATGVMATTAGASDTPLPGAPETPALPMQSAGFGAATGEVPPPAVEPPVMPPPGVGVPPPSPVAVSASTLMRAGFWIRIVASLLDTIIVAVAVHLLPDRWQPSFLLSFAAYCCVLWALRATTVGGIVFNLKVVRLDDRPMDWPTALVRTLGGFVSLIAAGLGFIWVAFDDQKQSWHDKIAGTTVVIVPKGVSLV